MGRCKYELLSAIEPALDEIRQFEGIKEPKPGIFYLKGQGFLHFHEKDGNIWADIRDGKVWGVPVDVPAKVTKKFLKEFVQIVRARFES